MAMALRVSTFSSIERRRAKQTALMHVCAVDEHSSNGTDGDRADKRNDVPFSFSFSPSPSSSCPSPRPPSSPLRHRASPCASLRAMLIPAPCPLALPPPPALSPAPASRPVTDQRLTGSRSALVSRSFSTTRCRTGRDEAIHAQVRESAGPRSSRSCPACPPGPLCLGRLSYWVYDVAVQRVTPGRRQPLGGRAADRAQSPNMVEPAVALSGPQERGRGSWTAAQDAGATGR